jgi:hypothetical protein
MKRIRKSTMVELVDELQKLRGDCPPERASALDDMISEARAGEYHEYKSGKYVCGKTESATRLDSLGYPALADRIKQGEFDEEPDAEDKKMISELLSGFVK